MQAAVREYIEQVEHYDSYEKAKPQLREVPQTERKSVLSGVSRLGIAACVVLILSIAFISVFAEVATTELGDRIVSATNELEMLTEEGARLNSKLSGAISILDVAEEAPEKLLMSPEEAYQITYVQVENEDVIVNNYVDEGESLYLKYTQMMNKIKEYMSAK